MHVVYDARVMAFQYTGLGRFTGELLFALLDMSEIDNIRYTVIIWEDLDIKEVNQLHIKLNEYKKNNLCSVVSVPCAPISISQHFSVSNYINRIGGDVYFYPHFDVPFCVNMPSVAVIHDLFPLKVKGYITKHSWLKIIYFKIMLRVIARNTKFIFAVSESTKRDLLIEVGQRFYSKVGVSFEGPIVRNIIIDPSFSPTLTVEDKYLLYVGDRRPHKNIKRIIDLFILLKDSGLYFGKLILVGSTKNHNFNVESYIGSRTDIQIAGQVDDVTLVTLYKRMDSLIFLSKYEGFGLPVVEAGLFNKKMIISDGGSLPEIAPSWAYVLTNDAQLEDYILEISNYLKQPVSIEEDYRHKYTWHAAAFRVKNRLIEIKDKKYAQ